MPDIICTHVETPTLQSQLGARGVGDDGKGDILNFHFFFGRPLGRWRGGSSQDAPAQNNGDLLGPEGFYRLRRDQ